MRYKPRGEARRECVQCGKTFKTSHGTQKTCGKECAREYRLLQVRKWHKDAARQKEDAMLRRRCSEILAAVPPGTMTEAEGMEYARSELESKRQRRTRAGRRQDQKGMRAVWEAVHDDPDAEDNMRQGMRQEPCGRTEKGLVRLALQEGKNMRPVRQGVQAVTGANKDLQQGMRQTQAERTSLPILQTAPQEGLGKDVHGVREGVPDPQGMECDLRQGMRQTPAEKVTNTRKVKIQA